MKPSKTRSKGQKRKRRSPKRTPSKPSPGAFSLRTQNRRAELLALAKSFGIAGRHRMTKPQLIEAIGAHLKKSRVHRAGKMRSGPYRSPTGLTGTFPKQSYDEIPWSYGQTELTMMPVDPFSVFAYWDFSRKDWEAVAARRRPVVLRVYDITMIRFDGTNAHSHFDVPVTLESQNWYVPLWSAEKSLCAELGWLEPNGMFRPIVRSNVIGTPRAGISTYRGERWVEVRWSRRRPTRRIQKRVPTARSQPDALRRPLERTAVPTSGWSGDLSSQSARIKRTSKADG